MTNNGNNAVMRIVVYSIGVLIVAAVTASFTFAATEIKDNREVTSKLLISDARQDERIRALENHYAEIKTALKEISDAVVFKGE